MTMGLLSLLSGLLNHLLFLCELGLKPESEFLPQAARTPSDCKVANMSSEKKHLGCNASKDLSFFQFLVSTGSLSRSLLLSLSLSPALRIQPASLNPSSWD